MAHTHKHTDKHIVISQGRFFCLLCADYCTIVPNKLVPNWYRDKEGDETES